MAKIPQGILGGIRGRVGNIVGAAWKGINYIRSMPLSVANPNTTAQQAQRGAFTQTVLVARLLLADLIATYWDPFARLMSGYNHFISINIDKFLTAGLDDAPNFAASRGILTGATITEVVASEAAATLTFTWTNNDGDGDALGTDEPVMVWFNESRLLWHFAKPAATTRALATATIGDGTFIETNVLHCWMFFIRPDLEKISDSEYYEETAVA